MIDEFNNDCPYDFKNILFKREITSSGKFDSSNGTLSWVYTFGRKYIGNLIDASLSGNLHGVVQNKIGCYLGWWYKPQYITDGMQKYYNRK